ncbi:MAG: rod shape-determining protein MreD [Syntrophales bacterium]|nr:rod shape-determining protein MreD [Syntrophales bacterium]MDD5641603.1 rod shape-determining protein MreD [Syntrophales bacterium]
MTVPVILFSLVGLGLFYFQNLLLFPQVRLRLVGLFLFYVGLRPSFSLAFSLAVVLGILQDSFATTPFGLHLGAALLLVGMARFCRRRLLLQKIGPLIIASLAALTLQEMGVMLILMLLGLRPLALSDLASLRSLEILATAALAPLMATLVIGLENFLSRHGWHTSRSMPQE